MAVASFEKLRTPAVAPSFEALRQPDRPLRLDQPMVSDPDAVGPFDAKETYQLHKKTGVETGIIARIFARIGQSAEANAKGHAQVVGDVVNAIKESPENLKIGGIQFSESVVNALKWMQDAYAAASPTQDLIGAGLDKLAGVPSHEPIDLVNNGADWLDKKARDLQTQQAIVTLENAPITKMARLVMQQGVPSAAVGVGLSLLTGSPAAGLAVFFATEGGQEYAEQRKAGASFDKASVIATLSGAAEVGGEMLVFPRFVKGLTQGLPLRSAIALIGENYGQEFATGFTQSMLSEVGKKTTAGMSIEQAARESLDTAWGNAKTSGLVGAGTAGLLDAASIPASYFKKMSELQAEREAINAQMQQAGGTAEAEQAPAAEVVPDGTVAPETAPIQGEASAQEMQAQAQEVAPAGMDAYDYVRAVNQLQDSLLKARRIAPVIRREQSQELSKRVGAASGTLESLLSKGVPAREAVRRSTGMLRGQLTEYEQRFEAIRDQLGEQTVETLHRNIATDAKLQYFQKDTMGGLLDKLLDGSALTYHQARLLGDYFGKGIGNAAVSRVSPGDRFWFLFMEALNLPRTALASMDQSGILRQARALGQANPTEYGQMVVKYQQAFFSEENALKIEKEYKQHPVYKEAKQVGLEMPEFGRIDVDINELSEQFMAARLLQKVPGVRASERSFVTATNWMRLSVYDKLVRQTEAMRGREMTMAEKKNLAHVINNLSGRSSLPDGLKALAPILNAAFFSPRFALSRFAMPKDIVAGGMRSLGEIGLDTEGKYQLKMRSELQPELSLAIKATASMVATNLAIMGLVQLVAGPDDDVEMEADPRATGFGKIRVGKLRLDLWAGYAQAARFLARMATGQVKTTTGEIREQERRDTLTDFLQSKESPLASLFSDAMRGEDMIGKPFASKPKGEYGKILDKLKVPKDLQGPIAETLTRITPMVIQDTLDAFVLEGIPEGITALSLGFFGAGVQTYSKTENQVAAEMKNTLAQRDFGKRWNDLKLSEQLDLRDRETVIGELERVAKRESYPVTSIDRTEEKNAGERIHKALSEPVQKAINEAGVKPEITRVISRGLWLNETRWKAYEQRAAAIIDSTVKELLPDLVGASEAERSDTIKEAVNRARAAARTSLLQDIEDGKL